MKKNLLIFVNLLTLSTIPVVAQQARISNSAAANKVLICHVPPGNPANAHNIEVSVNAVPAHIPGNNNHNDFFGNCFTGCNVMEIVSVSQGKQSNGTDVLADRSNTSTIFATDGVNQVGGFFSLGFGGEIIVKMDGGILNRPGMDLHISETSFNQPTCANYPEHAEIWVSKDMVAWSLAGTLCQDGDVDIAPLDWIRYVKVKDVSVASDFSGVVDGFDLDGLSCVPFPMQREVDAVAYADDMPGVAVFPNPARGAINMKFENIGMDQPVEVTLQDLSGKTVLQKTINLNSGSSSQQIDLSGISTGYHFLSIHSAELHSVEKILID